MHNPPIDLLANTPKPHKAAPLESEPDGRFSQMLRGASEAEAKQPESAPPAKSTQAAPTERPSRTEAGAEAPVEAGDHVAADEAVIESGDHVAPDETVIDSIVAVPEAITWARPLSGTVIAAAAAPVQPTGAPFAQTPLPADATLTPSATPTAPTGTRVPVPANAATLAEGFGRPGPTEPRNPGAITAAPPSPSPNAATQAFVATSAPAAAAGKAVARGDVPGGTAPAPNALPEAAAAGDAVPSDRPTAAPKTAPERLATAQVPARFPAQLPDSVRGEPGARKDMMDLPSTPESKAGADLNRAATTIPAAKTIAAPAAAPPAGDAPAAAAATAIPSTVAETADTAQPASQADPAAAANSGPIGRMTAATVSSTNLAHTPATAQPAAEQVVLQVQRAVREGVDRLTMQLKPASLGRVDIQMEVGFDGRLQAVISAERPETLHLLQRDARALTEALNDAGLQTDSGSLSFNLRGQSGDHGDGNSHEPSDVAATARSNAADDIGAATTEITLTLGDGRVDIKV